MSIHLDNPAWSKIALGSEDDIKESLITGYKQGKPYHPHKFHLLGQDVTVGSVLDFGCGIGRNFASLCQLTDKVVAYDLPEMIEACRKYSDCTEVRFAETWADVISEKYDMIVAIFVLQHILELESLEYILMKLASRAPYLYLGSRSWCDKSHANIARVMEQVGTWELVRNTEDYQKILATEYPGEIHFEALYRSLVGLPSVSDQALPQLDNTDVMTYANPDWRADITMLQLFDNNYVTFAYDVLRNKERYCNEHGYKFHYKFGIYPEYRDRHPSWHRIPYILERFDQYPADWFFWTDIDSLIMRPDVRLEAFVYEHANKDLIAVDQGPGICFDEVWDNCLCFGQFFIRDTAWSRRFLQKIWEFPEATGHERYLTEPSWEQEAVNYMYANNVLDCREHMAVVQSRRFNSFEHCQYQPGDFMVHFAGVRKWQELEQLVRKYLKVVPGREYRYVEEISTRADLSALLPKDGVGIELGVEQGIHALELYRFAEPREMHLIDFWSLHPQRDKWLRYKELVEQIFAEKTNVTIHDADIRNLLPTFPAEYFDWGYVDSWHDYYHVKRDIMLLLPKLKIGGYLCGHDFANRPGEWDTGPPRAVIEAIQNEPLEFVAITNEILGDWVLRKIA